MFVVLGLFNPLSLYPFCFDFGLEVGIFNKNKINRPAEYGRAHQLGPIGGNFLFVGKCDSVYMPDVQSLPYMLNTHEQLFGEGMLKSVATDKGYYSLENAEMSKVSANNSEIDEKIAIRQVRVDRKTFILLLCLF